MSRIVIVGAGLAGLATACHLSRTGHDITVVDERDQVGGLAVEWRDEGYVFDLGPTVLTMPSLIEATLAAAGSSLDALPMTQLDPAYRSFHPDGSHLDVVRDHDAMVAQIREVCGPEDAAAYDAYVPWLERLYDVEMPHFIDRNIATPLDLVSRPRAAQQLVRMGAFGNLDRLVGRRFRDPRLRKLFTFQALYAGVAPQKALGIYAVISYMDSVSGVFFPRDGMHALPEALAGAARSQGVTIRLQTPVTALHRDGGGRVRGVIAGDELIPADLVVHTGDVATAYRTLLAGARRPLALRRPTYSPSAVVWHVGTRGAPDPRLRHHNIHFGDAWARSFTELIDDRTLMSDPSRLVTVPTLTEPSRAPDGGSVLYVLEPVPALGRGGRGGGGLDWEREREPMRERLLGFLREHGYPTDIVTERLVTPGDWAAQGLAAGTPFSLAHLFRQTGPFRPSNAPRSLPGLVFAGAGTTPGVGVPMVLVSGRLAAERAVEQLGVAL